MSLQQIANVPHRTPALDLDVFGTILHFAEVRDLLRIGYASRLLRKEVVKQLLSRPVVVKYEARIKSFCSFMLNANDPSRCSYLQIFVCELAGVDPDVLSMLLEVFKRASNLRKLYLRRCDELFTEQDTRFADAIAQLPHLTLLQVWATQAVQGCVRSMVLRLRSTLKCLEFHMSTDDGHDDDDFPDEVAKCHPQLETLHISYPHMTSPWTPYLSLRVLALGLREPTINLQCIAETFPVLRKLIINALGLQFDMTPPGGGVDAVRHRAIAWQNGGGGWKSLDYLHGSAADLFMLCLTCPVRRLSIGQYDYMAHYAYRDIIARTRPRRVDMQIYVSTWFQTPITADPSLFIYDPDSMHSGAVSHLCLNVSVSGEDTITTRHIVDTITHCLEVSRLEYLRLEIAEFFFKEEDDYLLGINLPSVPPKLQQTMANLDIAELASALAKSGPALRTIVLAPVSQERTVWTVDRTNEQDILRRLDPYTASLVIEQEEK